MAFVSDDMQSIRHTLLLIWFEQHITLDRRGELDLGTLKQALMQRGVNSRGWRLYLDYGDSLFEQLGHPWVDDDWLYSSGHNAVAFLCLLQSCEMDVLPPPEFVRSMSQWGIPKDRLSLVPAGFFRAAWKACVAADYQRLPIREFISDYLLPLSRWFFSTGLYQEVETSLLKAGWAALERRYRESPDRRRPANKGEWPVPVWAVEFDGFRFTALATSADLKAEGVAMRHCIGGYDDLCRESSLRAYSVIHKKSGGRLATLTVAYSSQFNTWALDQIKGPGNAEVDERIVRATTALLQSLDEATAEDAAFRQFLRKLNGSSHSAIEMDFEDDVCCPF